MPKRPRQHQLEDQSRIAFRKILPPGWVFRDMAPDYGIDGEVEIFDEKENSTGLLFKVQLKSTGKADLKKAMVLIFERETLRYYISLKMPVLIVQFHAPTDRIFTKWAHTYDAYYEKKASKNLSFRYSLEDEWGLETPQRLATEVQELRNLDSPQPKLPLSFALIVEGQAIHGLKPSILTIKIRNLLAKIPDLIEIRPTQTNQCHTFIRINKNEVVITLAGKTFFTLHTTKDIPYETAQKNVTTQMC